MMNISERLHDISKRTGLSEETIRSVFNATRDSIADSLRKEDRATIPGICTFTAEIRSALMRDNTTGEMVNSKYVKVKSKPTQSFEKIVNTEQSIIEMLEVQEKEFKEESLKGMHYISTGNIIRTNQIGALL